MNGKWVFVLVLLCLWVGISAWDLLKPPSEDQYSQNVPAQKKQSGPDTTYITPDFFFTDLSGKSHRLYDFKGKTILLNFWATWCPPCVVEFPQLVALSKKEKADLVIIAVSVDKEVKDIRRFIKTAEEPLPAGLLIAHDPDRVISKTLFQTLLYPETYLIGPDLRIQRKIAGPLPPDFSIEETPEK